MLKVLRETGFKKNVFIFLVAVLVLSFVVSFIVVSQDDKNSYAALGQFEGKKITTQDYLASYRATQNQMRWMYGDRLNEVRNRVNLKGEAWDRILLLDHAKKNRIHVGDSEVVEWITSQPTFQRNGRFDADYYKMYVERALRADARTFEEEVRQMLTIRKVYEAEARKTSFSDEELEKMYAAEKAGKDVLAAVLPWEKFKAEAPAVGDAEIEQLYGIVKDTLTKPEAVRLSYITLTPAELEGQPAEGGSAPSDSHGGKAVLEDKAPLDELAARHGLTKKETGYFSKKDAVAGLDHFEVLSAAFSLAKGEESGWIHHDGGATKLRVDDKTAEAKMTMDEAREELKTLFARQKANELAMKKMKELKEKAAADFEGTMRAEGAEIQSMRYLKGAAHAIVPPQALDHAAGPLGPGEISEPVETMKGAMVVKAVAVTPLDEAAFEKDKAEFAERMKDEKAGEKMTELMESLRNKLSINLELMKEIFPAE